MNDDPAVPTSNQHGLGRGLPPGWRATEIRHAVIDFDLIDGRLEFFYKSTRTIPGADIEAAVQDALRRGEPFLGHETPLDLNVPHPSYILFQLANRNWQFRATGDAVTTKEQREQSYRGLVHVFPNGTTVQGGGTMADGCRLVYFASIDPPAGPAKPGKYEHGFNFHVDLIQAHNKRLPLVIDPDIKYPGGIE